jgi:hypothetical protein
MDKALVCVCVDVGRRHKVGSTARKCLCQIFGVRKKEREMKKRGRKDIFFKERAYINISYIYMSIYKPSHSFSLFTPSTLSLSLSFFLFLSKPYLSLSLSLSLSCFLTLSIYMERERERQRKDKIERERDSGHGVK